MTSACHCRFVFLGVFGASRTRQGKRETTYIEEDEA